MKRVLQVLGAVGGLVLLALAAVLVWGGPELRNFPWMPSSYEAKEYCSCRFVSGRSAAFCDEYIFQDVVPTQGRTVDEEARTVTARALFISTTARFVGEREGCVIQR
jgi:hypothetical protein